MARVPGVYVTIEDRSYVEPQPSIGRTALTVIMSDRGPHNRVYEISSYSEFFAFFGKPEVTRTGQAHYIATKFLEHSNRLFVIRPALLDSAEFSHNCAFSNAIVKYTPTDGFENRVVGKYVVISSEDATTEFGNDYISQYVFVDPIAYFTVGVGDSIFFDIDPTQTKYEVVSRKRINDNLAIIKLNSKYTGPSVVDELNENQQLIKLRSSDPGDPPLDVEDDDSYYSSLKIFSRAKREESGAAQSENVGFKFRQHSNLVRVLDEASFTEINLEDWIYAEGDDSTFAKQVIQKEYDEDKDEYIFYLSDRYDGDSEDTFVKVYNFNEIGLDFQVGAKSEDDFDELSLSNLFYFYGLGVGSYYNKIYIQGVRNTVQERMYTDDEGEPLYKYAFLDITIYGENPDGSPSVLEGPWTVSLIDKINDLPVRDLNTGRELYIVKTINSNSNYIRAKEGFGTSVLSGMDAQSEQLRLKINALFSVNLVEKTGVRGSEGFYLQHGSDGIQYDKWGRLNIYHPSIKTIVLNAYNCTLKSTDGSIEQLLYTVYPWYLIDYVLAGGYDVDVQNSARSLVDSRGDCLLLADTGQYSRSAKEDIDIRRNDMPWNTWNAAIYTQFRTINDPFSGKDLVISPVYHAIDRHLWVDNRYFMSEPVAGIEKGAIQDRSRFAYKPSLKDMEDMIDYELNPVISEPDGTYIITQFTTYKRLSIMKRIHAVKIIHYLKKRLPSILKDILQRRATPYWISVAGSRIATFMNPFTDPNSMKYSFTEFSSNIVFDEERSEMYISLTVRPVRAIESIHVNIIVV